MSHPPATGSGPVEDRHFLQKDQEGLSEMLGVVQKTQ